MIIGPFYFSELGQYGGAEAAYCRPAALATAAD